MRGRNPTGVVRGAGGVAFVAAKIPHADAEAWLANTRKLVTYLNSLGITAWSDLGGRGMSARTTSPISISPSAASSTCACSGSPSASRRRPSRWTRCIAEVPQQKPFQGNDYFDHIGWGESTYGPATTNTMRADGAGTTRRPWRSRPSRARRWPSTASTSMPMSRWRPPIDAFLDQYEAINRKHPIKGLRWAFSHLDQVTEAQLERMKRLGMSAQLHSRPLIQGVADAQGAWREGLGHAAVPPRAGLRHPLGLGSDATAVTPSNPFYTLSFAVTGKMVGGRHVNRQTITREEALIAHTRSTPLFLFQEGNLGSLARGKYADLLVLDRDYLTVPADEIKDIKPVLTMVGGKVVWEAKSRR